jgi:hypothetical protein
MPGKPKIKQMIDIEQKKIIFVNMSRHLSRYNLEKTRLGAAVHPGSLQAVLQ